MSVIEAPDVLDGERSGVRRLNRRPLMIVAVIVAIVLAIVMYTMADRASQDDVLRKGEAKKVEPVSLDSLFTNAPDAGLIAAKVLPSSVEPILPEMAEPTDGVSRPGSSGPTPAADEQYAREWELYRQQVNQVQQAKMQAAMGALTADPSVPSARTDQSAGGGEGEGRAGGQGAAQDDPAAGIRASMAAMLSKVQGGAGGAPGSGAGGSGEDANNASGKVNWLKSAANADHYLPHAREDAISPYELKAGSVIPGVMIGGINADLPGQIIGQVRENVFDSATGETLLIPQGARLIGSYDNQVTRGQSRVLVAWNRIIYPDASSVDLDVMPGVDQAGFAGFKDKVNNHYIRVFGDSVLMSLFAAGIQLSQPQSSNQTSGYDSQQIIAGSLGQQLGQTGQQLAQANLRIQPTLEIRPGYRFAVMVTKDMIIEPWRPQR